MDEQMVLELVKLRFPNLSAFAQSDIRDFGMELMVASPTLPLHETEKHAILRAVREYPTVLSAARALGIGKTTLYRKMRKFRCHATNANSNV